MYFAGIGLRMEPTLAALCELEMFDRIGDITAIPINPSHDQGCIQNSARRPDKWASEDIFPVARLLADQNDICLFWPLAKDRLSGMLVEIASFAMLCLAVEFAQ